MFRPLQLLLGKIVTRGTLRVTDAATAATDASAAAEKAVLFSVRKSRWAPRLEDGKPVDTEGVTLRERLLIRKPSEAKPAKGP